MIGSRPQLTPISLFCCSVTQKDGSLPLKPQGATYTPSACLCRFVQVINLRISIQWLKKKRLFVWQRGHGTWRDSQHLKTKRQSPPQPIGIQSGSSVIVHFQATIHVMSCFSNPGAPFLHKVIEKHNTIIWDRGMARNKGLSESSENARRILKVGVNCLLGLWFIHSEKLIQEQFCIFLINCQHGSKGTKYFSPRSGLRCM